MATTVTNSSRGLVRAALAFALAGLLAVLSGGLLMITGGSAASVTQDDMGVVYSQDPGNPTLVEEVPEGFEPYGEPTVTEDDCITTTVQVYSHLVSEATEGSYTAWVDEGEPVQTEEDVAPGEDTEFVQWLPAGTVKVVDQELVPGTPAQDTRVWWVLKGKDWAPNTGTPPADHPSWKAQPNLPSDNSQHAYPGENGLGVPYQPGADNGNGDWFRFTGELTPAVPETPEVSHTEYLWQKQVRTLVEGSEAVVEYVYTTVSEGEPCDETEPPEVLPTEETEPTEPAGPDDSAGPADSAGPSDTTGPEEQADLEVLGEQATRPTRTVPRAVDAGVGGRTAAEMWGAGLVGGGLVLLLAAGGALIGARRLEIS